MAARKKKSAVTQTPAQDNHTIVGPEHRDGGMYFSRSDLAHYELVLSRIENINMRAQLCLHRIDEEKRASADRIQSFRNDHAVALKELEKAKAAALALEAEIVEKYKVDLTSITYDTETGRINQLPSKK